MLLNGLLLFCQIFLTFVASNVADVAPELDVCDKTYDLVCPAGWEIKENCGKVYCYRSHEVPPQHRNWIALSSDLCAPVYKGSKTLSIHCEEENDYLWKFDNFAIGLFLPQSEPKGSTNWKWVDGSPLDYTRWELFKQNPAPYSESPEDRVIYYKNSKGRFGWIDRYQSNFTKIICKMPAAKVKKTQPCTAAENNLEISSALPQSNPPIFNGCAKVYDYSCPAGSRMWEACGKVQCYRKMRTLLEEQTTEWLIKDLCAKHLNGSKTASIHCDKENELLFKYDNFINGLYIPQNKPVTSNEWHWVDGSPMDYKAWENLNGKIAPYRLRGDTERLSFFRGDWGRYGWIDFPAWLPEFEYLICKQPANKIQRTRSCEPPRALAVPKQDAPIIDICDTENDLVCKEGWELKENCGKVYCYHSLEVAPQHRNWIALSSDLCGVSFEGSKTLSIHCEEENDYLWKFDNFAIGLYLPQSESAYSKNWKWVDGTSVDYTFWESFVEKRAPYFESVDDRVVYYKATKGRFGWIDRNQFNFTQIICKMPATKVKKTQPCTAVAKNSEIITILPKINPPIKEACAKVYDYQCPSKDWKMWESCGKVHCYYRLTTKPEEQTYEWLIKDLCALKLNGSKTASIHCDKENDLLWKYDNFFNGLYIPQNKPITINEWQWVDGTPMDYTSWETFHGKKAPFRRRTTDRLTYFRGDWDRYGWFDFPYWLGNFNFLICKQPAIKVERTTNIGSGITLAQCPKKDHTVAPPPTQPPTRKPPVHSCRVKT